MLHMTPRLYPNLLGDSWDRLDETVRHFHESGDVVRATGNFRVQHGNNFVSRWLARLMRFPPAGDAVNVVLIVRNDEGKEEWLRTFDGRPMATVQTPTSAGLLAERMGLTELRLRLTVVDGALCYDTIRTAVCFGRLRLPLPSWLGPNVSARESAAGDGNQIDVSVHVKVPLLGRFISYEGTLTHIEVQP